MKDSLSGKTILVTGSTDGLGKLVAQHLAIMGANILLHGRNKEKGTFVLQELSKLSHNSGLKYYNGDFASLDEVNELTDSLLKDNKNIYFLINNVGIGTGKRWDNRRELSKDGLELRFAVNYLAHVLLTERLLPVLKPYESTIINVASVGQVPIDFSNLMLEERYDGYFAYKQSKTALIMYTFDLADRLLKDNIKVNAIHPASLMNTKMVINDWGYTLTTVEQGAEAVENLLFSDSTGAYFDGKHPSEAIAQTYDPDSRQKLNEITWQLLDKYLR